MLKINNLKKNFGKKKVLTEVSAELDYGIYGLLGPNGAGKTTLIRCITQLYPCDKTAISYNGTPISQQKDYLSRIGYLPQKFGLFRDLSVYEAMELLAINKKLPKDKTKDEILRCVEAVNLSDRIKSKVKTLSGGMVKRLGIAQALLGDPEILIFDEPTAGLDPEERLRFKLIVSDLSKDKIVLISTHIVTDIEATCDKVLVMNNGKFIAAGTCEEIKNHAAGKVYLVPKEDISKLEGKYFIENQVENSSKILCRVITNSEIPYERAETTLEDGYMYLLKEE